MSSPEDSVAHVKRYFAFLIDEYGFQITKEEVAVDSFVVEYASDRIYVRVLATPPDFEPRFVIGRTNCEKPTESTVFDWVDVGGLDCCRGWKWQRDESQPLAGRIVELARMLRDCGMHVLNGEAKAFEEMTKRRIESKKLHLHEELAYTIRSQVETAWNTRDYKSVIALYSRIADQLSDLEKKRLSYAEMFHRQ